MTYELSQKDALEFLNDSLAAAVRDNSAVSGIFFVNAELSPGFDRRSELPRRESFQARVEGGNAFRRISIAPPTDMLPVLLDWSESGIAGAKFAAKSCSAIYGKAVEGLPQSDNPQRNPLSMDVVEAILTKAMEQGFSAMRRHKVDVSSSPQATDFMAECARAAVMIPTLSEVHALAYRAALRDWAQDVDPVNADSLLAQAPASFKPLLSASDAAGVKISTKQKAYQLCKNGSFSASVHTQADHAHEVAKPFACSPDMLGMEHCFHQHYLTTPDGVIHGAKLIKVWADATLAFREAVEIGSNAKSGVNLSRSTL